MTQKFKGDDIELKMESVQGPTLSSISDNLDDFFDQAYATVPLGALIFDDMRSPLSNAISRGIFINAFAEIVEAFIEAGSLEAYLTVFRKIFGDDVIVAFDIPAPGKLLIDITTPGGVSSVESSRLVARHIESDAYVYDEIITFDGDHIIVTTVKGFTSQYELEQMLFEMVPGGIYTEITLTILGEG